jgi:acyl-CoA synthetase (AMP-forming)/AMP-acid ligase II
MGIEFTEFKMPLPSDFLPLHQLLEKKSVAAWDSYWNDNEDPKIKHYQSYIASIIKSISNTKAKRVFVISKDRAYFLAGLLAAFHAGLPVVLPPLDAPEFLKELMQPDDCLLADQKNSISLCISMADIEIDHSPIKFSTLNPSNTLLTFYTSGSTGAPKRVDKCLKQLETEVRVLQNIWGGFKGNFLSTVSHQHIYGLLFSLLWPVCAGYPLKRQTFFFWEDLSNYLTNDDCVVSSPAHLGRFPVLNKKDMQINRVFCSGGALSFEAAKATQECLDVLPTEVYGSTETGGIGYRQQSEQATPWRRFSNIEIQVKADQRLSVKSSYLADDHFYQTEDYVSVVDKNTFHLLGRADRIVKIEGKRVCLLEVERRLASLDSIQEVAVLLLENTKRSEIGAVVVLSHEGQKKLLSGGKIKLIREIRQNLSVYLDRVVMPRKWRFVSKIPVNAQGKKSYRLLQQLLRKSVSLMGQVRYPEILKTELSDEVVNLTIKIPENLSYFEGHFSEMPVVPGVVQLDWVVKFAIQHFKISGRVSEGNRIKFSQLMRPLDEICLTLQHTPEKKSVSYRYKLGDKFYASGSFVYL